MQEGNLTGDVTSENVLFVPNFNDALLTLVIFHSTQSIPLLRYNFKESGHNFDEQLLSGMISAIITVSEEIDKEHKSVLRKIDQTGYSIILEMRRQVGIIIFALREENDEIIRDFARYLIAEFERRYRDKLEDEMAIFPGMYDDFIPVIKKTAMVPIALSTRMIADLIPTIHEHGKNLNVIICDKLIFTPVFKYFSDYTTPNEVRFIREYIRDTFITATRFLDNMQKFGELETIQLNTAKRTIYMGNLDPFYIFVIQRRSQLHKDYESINLFLEKIREVIRRNTLRLTTKQRIWLFNVIEMVRKEHPGLKARELHDLVLDGIMHFQANTNLLLNKTQQFTTEERRGIFNSLLNFVIQHVVANRRDIADIKEKLESLRENIVKSYEAVLL